MHETSHPSPAQANTRLTRFESADALAEAVAAVVRERLTAALAARERASLVVTGGSTPAAYTPRLAALDLPWARVTVTLTDERFVPPDDPLSNEGLVRRTLLQGPAAAAGFVPLFHAGVGLAESAARAAAGLDALARPYDLVLLGLGNDSHIASLFPRPGGEDPAALALDDPKRCHAIVPPPGVTPAVPRISMGLGELLNARAWLFAAQGESKLAAWERAVAGAWPLPSPVHALVRHAAHPIDFFWCP